MKDKIQILCYGDSNTWGCIGRWKDSNHPSERYDTEHRWPDVLQADLGEDYHVISEGLGGRTTIYNKPDEPWKNGETYLKPCLYSHRPLDLVIVMLGTNDLTAKCDMTPGELSVGITRLVNQIQEAWSCGRGEKSPKILVLAPTEVQPSSPEGRVNVYEKFRKDIGRNLSRMFPEVYAKVAKEKNCYFLNAAAYAKPGPADGVHFDAESHVRLGHAVAEFIKNQTDLI